MHSAVAISPVPCSEQAGQQGQCVDIRLVRALRTGSTFGRPGGGRRGDEAKGARSATREDGHGEAPGEVGVAGGTGRRDGGGAGTVARPGRPGRPARRRGSRPRRSTSGPSRRCRARWPGFRRAGSRDDRLLQHPQRQGRHQRSQDRPDQQPGRRGITQPVHPGRPHRSSTRTTSSRSAWPSAWFTPGLLRVDQDAHLRLQRLGQLADRPQPVRGGRIDPDLLAGLPQMAYFIKKVGAKSVAFISYGPSIASSYDACNATPTG